MIAARAARVSGCFRKAQHRPHLPGVRCRYIPGQCNASRRHVRGADHVRGRREDLERLKTAARAQRVVPTSGRTRRVTASRSARRRPRARQARRSRATQDGRACAACGANQWQDATGHREQECKTQPRARQREDLERLEDGRARAACGANQWQDATGHREQVQGAITCAAGEKISSDSKTAARACSACGANQWQDATGHREQECKTQTTARQARRSRATRRRPRVRAALVVPTSGRTRRVTASRVQDADHVRGRREDLERLKTAARACSACGANQWQDATGHREQECKTQTTCAAGEEDLERLEDGCTRVQRLWCQPVAGRDGSPRAGARRRPRARQARRSRATRRRLHARARLWCQPVADATGHREQECKTQTTCAAGEKISSDSKTAARACSAVAPTSGRTRRVTASRSARREPRARQARRSRATRRPLRVAACLVKMALTRPVRHIERAFVSSMQRAQRVSTLSRLFQKTSIVHANKCVRLCTWYASNGIDCDTHGAPVCISCDNHYTLVVVEAKRRVVCEDNAVALEQERRQRKRRARLLS